MTRRAALAINGAYLGMFVSILGQTIVATTLPSVAADLGDFAHYGWVFTVYGLGVTVTMPIAGQLADRHSRPRLFLIGTVLFTLGACLCAAASSLDEIVVGRGVQGVGAALTLVIAMVTVGDFVPAADRARWHSLAGANFAVAALLGPLLGGLLAESGGWRLTFLVPLPISMLGAALILAGPWPPPAATRRARTDYAGGLLLATAITGVLLGLSSLTEGGGSAVLAVLFAVGVLAAVALATRHRTAPSPILSPALTSLRPFAFANAIGFIVGAALFAAMMMLPIVWQGVLGRSSSGSGFVLVPMMLALFAGSLAGGSYVSRRRNYRAILYGGPLTIAAGFVGLALVGPHSPVALFIVLSATVGLGIGCLFQPLLVVVQTAAPPDSLGAATSSAQFARQLGGAFGVTLAGVLLDQGLSPTAKGALAPQTLDGLSGLSSYFAGQLSDASHLAFLALAGMALLAVSVAPALTGVSIERPLG